MEMIISPDCTTFVFDNLAEMSNEFQTGSNIFAWMDQHIKLTAFIEFNLVKIGIDPDGLYVMVYQVRPTKKLPYIHSWRHLALLDKCLN